MNRFDRALALLLLLRSGRTFSAPDLARRLSVSVRTIYRDMDTLSEVGVPIYAETGREGGYRLVEGYFLPPIAFTAGEATSLLTGLALLNRLQARPFAAELETAAHKLLAVVPDSLRHVLAHAQRVIGFEAIPYDIFHPEMTQVTTLVTGTEPVGETQAITVFLKCIFEERAVAVTYRSPHRGIEQTHIAVPCGILWDRDRWYLIGQRLGENETPRLWRADRVVNIAAHHQQVSMAANFSIEDMLNRRWLDEAMSEWAQMSPVMIRMTAAQANRLKQDWYYAHALFETTSDGAVVMTYGENNQAFVFELLRWLGQGAILLEPEAWRAEFAAELRVLLATYEA